MFLQIDIFLSYILDIDIFTFFTINMYFNFIPIPYYILQSLKINLFIFIRKLDWIAHYFIASCIIQCCRVR